MLAQHLTSRSLCRTKHLAHSRLDVVVVTSSLAVRASAASAQVQRCENIRRRPGVPQQQDRFHSFFFSGGVQALVDIEAIQADSWSLDARAAMLGTTWEKFEAVLGDLPQLATCDPACLFALKESAELLGLSVPDMLQLVKQVPAILETPTTVLQQNIQTLQTSLQMPRPSVVRLLVCDPALIAADWKTVDHLVQRINKALWVSRPQQRQQLSEVLAALVSVVQLSDPQQLVQQVQSVASMLGVSPTDALAVLQAESRAFGDLQQLIIGLDVIEAQWQEFSKSVGMPQRRVMECLVQQLLNPDARYSLQSPAQLSKDVAHLCAVSHLSQPVAVEMLLSTPQLMSVPGSFWDLLLQYLLFLAPAWRKELDDMTAPEAGRLVVDLFQGSESSDVISVSSEDLTWATADSDYGRDLEVLGALLDSGIEAPVLESPDQIQAGKLWRLIYLCNPRLSEAQQQAAQAAAQADGDSSGRSSTWSWVPMQLLPPALMRQRQERAALTSELGPTAPASREDMPGISGSINAGSGAVYRADQEAVESLLDAVSADTATFCSRHPGYAHWLHNAAFELEWSNHEAAAPLPTWDV